MSKIKKSKKELSLQEHSTLLKTLQTRFEKNMHRHKGIDWKKVESKLEKNPRQNDSVGLAEKLWSLNQMEITGGEPDVIYQDKNSGEYFFCDCSPETPKDRRSFCYDHEALESRKEHKPKNSAVGMATEMGIEILNEEQYLELQKLGPFDTKTSSWVKTPATIRALGGALFCDFRYGKVFTYHNGAESYYAGRGFRGSIRV